MDQNENFRALFDSQEERLIVEQEQVGPVNPIRAINDDSVFLN